MADIEQSTRKLTRLYKNAQREIVAAMNTATGSRKANLSAISAQIDGILATLQGQTNQIVNTETSRHFKDGVARATNAIRSAGLNLEGGFNLIDEEAIRAIADETLAEFGQSLSGAKNSTEKIITKVRKDRINDIVATGRITGETDKTIAKNIKEELANGVTGLVDRGGRRWSLDAYSEMLTRTKMRETTNLGLTNRLTSEGFDLVKVSNHNSDHKECAEWEGKILSITGNSDYPTVEDATNAGLFHPNCKHRLLPYHPEIQEMAKMTNLSQGFEEKIANEDAKAIGQVFDTEFLARAKKELLDNIHSESHKISVEEQLAKAVQDNDLRKYVNTLYPAIPDTHKARIKEMVTALENNGAEVKKILSAT